MNLTQVLAVVGAATGVTGAVLGMSSFVRDRARLIMFARVLLQEKREHGPGTELCVVIYMVNSGRQPISILGLGIGSRGKHPPISLQSGAAFFRWALFRNRDRSIPAGYYAVSPSDGEPVFLKPGELKKLSLTADPPGEDDRTWQAFAIDYRNHVYWVKEPRLPAADYQYPGISVII
jgi:hypothetical protein